VDVNVPVMKMCIKTYSSSGILKYKVLNFTFIFMQFIFQCVKFHRVCAYFMTTAMCGCQIDKKRKPGLGTLQGGIGKAKGSV